MKMRHLFAHWDDVRKQIGNRCIILFLDYDGTLTPIVGHPDKAIISPKIKEPLKRLCRSRRCVPAIITGRSLKDIRKKAGLKNIIYAANHGLQIKGPKIRFNVPVPLKYKTILRYIKKELEKRLAEVKGVFMEDKGLSLSLHYRLVNSKKVPFVKNCFHQITAPYRKSREIKTTTGKKLLEIRPAVKWNKGKAVMWLSKSLSSAGDSLFFPIYIGDDLTDEDAFRALKNKGLTVIVGRNTKSSAQYYVRNTRETLDFIRWILKICENCQP